MRLQGLFNRKVTPKQTMQQAVIVYQQLTCYHIIFGITNPIVYLSLQVHLKIYDPKIFKNNIIITNG